MLINKYHIVFNNLSSNSLGLSVISRPNFSSLKKKYNEYEVLGREGKLYEFLGYEDNVIEVKFNFCELNNINSKVRLIKKWLNNIENNKLSFSDDPLVFYKVKKVEYENIERKLKIKGSFNLKFICEPYFYSFSSQEEIEIKNDETLINDGDFISKPIIKIEGNGEVNLNINGKPIKLNIGQEIIINSELELCYRESLKDMQNSQMSGDFPILDIGENKISWDKNVKRLSIIPNYRYY